MMSANEEVPDMEKLEKHEFILDTEEHERLKVCRNRILWKNACTDTPIFSRLRRVNRSVWCMRRQSWLT